MTKSLTCAWRAALAAAALAAGGANDAMAQSPSNKAPAEALFQEGRQLMEEGKLAEACPKLAESQRLDPAIGTLLNLAFCYEKNGQTATAWATYREAQSAALAARRPEQAASAERRAGLLAPKLSRLTIVVASWVEGMEVKRDGVALGKPAFGVAMPVDPGKHTITASAPRKKPFSAVVIVGADAASASITVPALEDAPASAPEGPPSHLVSQGPVALTPPRLGNPGGAQRTAGMVTTGLGAIGLVVGGAFVLVGKSRYDDSLSHCRNENLCDAKGLSLRDDARSAGTVATFALGAGGALLAGGLTLWLTAPRSHEQSARLRISPSLGGAVVGGTF